MIHGEQLQQRGRSLTTGTMMGAMLKGDQKLTIKVEGNGPIGPILVDAHANGDVRGYVTNPHVDFEGTEQGEITCISGGRY